MLVAWQKQNKESGSNSIDHLALARSASGNNNFAEAEKEYKTLLSTASDDSALWREYGYVLQQQRKREEAVSAYEKALSMNKDDATTQNFLGNLYRDLNQYDKAETAYKEAISLNPNLLPAVINLAHLYTLQGKTNDAIALLASVYDGTKQRSEIGLQLSAAYLRNNNATEARAALDKILNLDPENEKAKEMIKSL
jgi:superkiller protein 3